MGATHCLRNHECERADELEALMSRYARLVRSVVGRVGGAAAAKVGDDIEQQVFLDIWRQLSAERRIEHPSSYIYRAAVRETIRALKRERRHEPAEELADSAAVEARPDASPVVRLERHEARRGIHRALASLSEPRRRAVRKHLLGFSVGEIMAREGWSYNRARNLIARGMADLRRGLATEQMQS